MAVRIPHLGDLKSPLKILPLLSAFQRSGAPDLPSPSPNLRRPLCPASVPVPVSATCLARRPDFRPDSAPVRLPASPFLLFRRKSPPLLLLQPPPLLLPSALLIILTARISFPLLPSLPRPSLLNLKWRRWPVRQVLPSCRPPDGEPPCRPPPCRLRVRRPWDSGRRLRYRRRYRDPPVPPSRRRKKTKTIEQGGEIIHITEKVRKWRIGGLAR